MTEKERKQLEKINNEPENISAIILGLFSQRNGEKFRKLFSDGDTQGYDRKESAAIALCEIINYKAQGDAALIDNIFRMSKLYDEKWDDETYRQKILNATLKYADKNTKARPVFIEVDEKTGKESISKPLLLRYIIENLPYLIVRPNESEAGYIYYYCDGVYKKYSQEMFNGEILKLITDYNPILVPTSSFINDIHRLVTMSTQYTQLNLFESNENIINLKNGVYDIEKGKLFPHSKEHLSTVQIDCEWHEERIKTPVFDKYLRTLSDGDKEIEEFLLQYMGICISNIHGKRLKKALFLFGDGNTGKSQYKLLIESLLGEKNCQSIDLNQLEARFGTGAIFGKRLIGSADMSYASVNEMKNFKQLTGGDMIFAEKKGEQAFQFEYRGMMLFVANKMPLFGGDNGRWVYDRIIPLKCENIISDRERDPQILEKMIAEKNGILQKIIPAIKRVIANGFKFDEPKKVVLERELYEARNNSVVKFIKDKMISAPTSRSTISVIYAYYKKWCDDNAFYAKDSNQFKANIAEYLQKPERETYIHRNDGLHIVGLDIN